MLRLTRIIAVLLTLPLGNTSLSTPMITRHEPVCRYLPSDAAWPGPRIWQDLNHTTGGRLIRGVPLGEPCYGSQLNILECSKIKDNWTSLSPYEADPVNIMSPYWMNNSCSPFFGPQGSCTLGNLASYALDISTVEDVIAGVQFAQNNNIRLTIKNTGHDYLGRSAGAGSLGLWMRNLDNIDFFNYSSSFYTGPAVHIGAGVGYDDLYPAASAEGYRVVGGSCSTVGITGGFSQGGGHGPLASQYGLGADQVLEWEVVTAAGHHLIASPTENADLYWALSGGGAGNFAIVLSMTVRAYADGPVAGAAFSFANTGNTTAYWAGINAWLRSLLTLDKISGLTTVWSVTAGEFSLEFSTLPDVTTTANIDTALAPFFKELKALNVSLGESYTADVHTNFAEHYNFWAQQVYTSNISLGSRLIPRSTVQDVDVALPALIKTFRKITDSGGKIISVTANVTYGNYTPNAVLPSWRDALFTTSFAMLLAENAGWNDIRNNQAQLNAWQEELRAITPGGGAYMNEATWDNHYWKEDYFGANYEALLTVKKKYDPKNLFWANAAIGSDAYWKVAKNGALCRA